jgi:drug/metabolite transporter (DMT)-like permease
MALQNNFEERFLAYLWMLIGSIFFAIMALLAESLKEQFSYPWITMVRSGIATILALGLACAAGAKLVFLRPLTLWVRSLSGWASMICGFYALTHYDVEIVLALTNMYPLWVAVLSWPLLGVLPSSKTWTALAISCVGMWLVYSSSISIESPSDYSSPRTAIPMAILAGILSGVALINLHRVRHIDTRAVVAHFSAVATSCSLMVWLFIPVMPSTKPIDAPGVARLIGIGIAATVGQLCLTKAFSSGSPARVSVVGLSQIVFAALVKWALEHRIPTTGSMIGMGLVIASTVWVILSQPSEQELEEPISA